MKLFWDERYNTDEYVYGITPNSYLKNFIDKNTPGKILFPADGEGRNSVYAAKKGWDVYAFDSSIYAKKKADKLAKINNVKINYEVKNFNAVSFNSEFDAVVLIYAHFPPELRKIFHSKTISFLTHKGKIILEAFSKGQINYNSGGPRDINRLYDEHDLQEDFKAKKIHLNTEIIELNEGAFHKGNAEVIRLYAEKI